MGALDFFFVFALLVVLTIFLVLALFVVLVLFLGIVAPRGGSESASRYTATQVIATEYITERVGDRSTKGTPLDVLLQY